MKRLRLATIAAVAALGLLSGCQSTGGTWCNGGLMSRLGLRSRSSVCYEGMIGDPTCCGLPVSSGPYYDGHALGDAFPGSNGLTYPAPLTSNGGGFNYPYMSTPAVPGGPPATLPPPNLWPGGTYPGPTTNEPPLNPGNPSNAQAFPAGPTPGGPTSRSR